MNTYKQNCKHQKHHWDCRGRGGGPTERWTVLTEPIHLYTRAGTCRDTWQDVSYQWLVNSIQFHLSYSERKSDVLLLTLAAVVNQSLESGTLPSELKSG